MLIKKYLGLFISLIIIIGVLGLGWPIYIWFGFTGFLIYYSLLLSVQSFFTLRWMLYSWNSFHTDAIFTAPDVFDAPKTSFSILLPVRHEEKVLGDTLAALERINYPKDLIEIIVLVRGDDTETIDVANKTVTKLGVNNISVEVFNDGAINKPHALNIGLGVSKNDVIVIFDAEDEVHPGLFNLINTTILRENVDVIQAGVQLVDYDSHWYSVLNVLEYYFWYKSGLYFFIDKCKAAPLGGNTVFFKHDLLTKIGGWDENCLTEDADIGIAVSSVNAKIKVLYVERYATQEETPPTVSAFIKQRTRWNQGFLQVYLKGDWLKLTSLKRKAVILYLLITPLIQTLILFYTPFGIYLATVHQFSVPITLITYFPLYMVIIQIAVYIFGFYKFVSEYKLKFSFTVPFRILLVYFPYQLLLAFSAMRSIFRMLINSNGWEKTHHKNSHRTEKSYV